MINWMRAYNLSGQGQIQFTGFDMQWSAAAIENVRNFVTSSDPGYMATLNAAFALATSVANNSYYGVSQSDSVVQAATDAVDAVRQYLTDHRSVYLANNTASAVDWAIQNAVIVEQATYLPIGGTNFYRDACMAANIEWILKQNPGARIVLLAHDGHVRRYPNTMGSYLAANHGDDYVVLGHIFHAGSYNAYNNGIFMANNATTSFPGTVEYVLHSTGMPQFMLDMRRASHSNPNSSWLFGNAQYRGIGAIAGDGFQFTYQLTTDYDVLIFFDQTTPSELLPFN